MSNGNNDIYHSHSALSLYRDCQTRYKFERIDRLTPRGRGFNHDLRYGSAAHEVLAVLYATGDIQNLGRIFKDVYPCEEYPDNLPSWAQGKTQANFLAALWHYIQNQYQGDLAEWEIIEVEQPQTTEGLGEYDYNLVPDMIVRSKSDGLTWIVDHKITGAYLDDKFWSRFSMSSQIRMYTDEIKRRYGQCGGFIVNAISLRYRSRGVTPRSGPNKGTYLEAGFWYDFGRMVYCCDENKLAVERSNVRATINQINRSIDNDEWSYNTNRCHGGTMFECPYFRICENGYQWPRDQFMIEESYRVRCGKQLAGEIRCELDEDHTGECSRVAPVDSPAPMVDYEMDYAVED